MIEKIGSVNYEYRTGIGNNKTGKLNHKQPSFKGIPFSKQMMVVLDRVLKPGNPYIKKVDDCFYRGSQLKPNDIEKLSEKGIKTILSLKNESHKKINEFTETAKNFGIKYINIPINPLKKPEKEMGEILEILNKSSAEPVFTHCLHGKDRTGLVSAMYRVMKHGWDPNQAYQEMKTMGYNSTAFPALKKSLFESTSGIKNSLTKPA